MNVSEYIMIKVYHGIELFETILGWCCGIGNSLLLYSNQIWRYIKKIDVFQFKKNSKFT